MASTGTLSTRSAPALVVSAAVLGVGGGYLLFRWITPATVDLLKAWSGPLWLTLRIAVMSIVIAGVLGIAGGYALARGHFPGRDLLEAVGSIPIILPPTVLGYYLLTSLNERTWLGRFAATVLGRSPIFDIRGCVIVGTIAAFPFCLRAARSAIEAVDTRFEQAARTMGLPGWRVVLQVTIPLARRGIGVGLTLGFLRALGEYGATLMVGGAYRGRTRTMSIAVLDEPTWAQTQADLRVLLILAILALSLMAWLQRGRR
jgi:molybdate transport system permease protein